MNAGIIARRYAAVLYIFADGRGGQEQVYADAALVWRALGQEPRMQAFLCSAIRKPSEKKAMTKSVFGNFVCPITMQFIDFVADKERSDMLREILRVYMVIYKERKNIKSAVVTTATPCDEARQKEITSLLGAKLNATIDAQFRTKEDLIGGVIIEVDGSQIDCSVSRRLSDMRKALAS